jgi:MFS family permease
MPSPGAAPAEEADAEARPRALVPTTMALDVSVWRNRPFLRLWAAQAITQTAHNALWYALMVLVEQRSHSVTHMGVTILTVVIPSVLFGIIAGVLVDHWDKRRVLITCNALRALMMVGFIVFDQWLLALFLLSFLFSTVTQFFAPAETAMIPALVHQRRLMQANSLFHITFIASQLAGLVFVGPLIVKLFGLTVFFILVGGALALSALLVWPLPRTPEVVALSPAVEGRRVWRRLRQDLRELVTFLQQDGQVARAMLQLTLGSTLTLVVAMLAPNYVVSVLGIAAEDVVFVIAPAGIGMLLAALSLQHLSNRIPKERLIQFGEGAVGTALVLVGTLPTLWRLLPFTRTLASSPDPSGQAITFHVPWVEVVIQIALPAYEPHLPSLLACIMATTFIAGLGFACIIVPAQTILQERAPATSRGRIFAVQLMLGSLASVLPILFIGGIADLVGAPWVFLALGVGLLGFLRWAASPTMGLAGSLARRVQPGTEPSEQRSP